MHESERQKKGGKKDNTISASSQKPRDFQPEGIPRLVTRSIIPEHELQDALQLRPEVDPITGSRLGEGMYEPGPFWAVLGRDAAEGEGPEEGDLCVRVGPEGGCVGGLL